MSQASGMDLYEYVKINGKLQEDETKIVAKKIFRTLRSIHDKKVIHKDIKPENIIYDNNKNRVTIIDFEEKFTTDYQSPEQVNGKKLTVKSDIWSVGVTLFFLLTNRLPFDTEKDILSKKVKYPDYISKTCRDFLNCLLERDIDLRYDSDQCLNHIWIQD